MLGLVLVVIATALLMGGTLNGLWSYYLTTNAIRAKMDELKAADAFKDAVTALVEPSDLELLALQPIQKIDAVLKRQVDRESLSKGGDVEKALLRLLDVHETLDRYRQQWGDNPNNRPEAGGGLHERELVEVLARDLDEFETALRRRVTRPGFLGDRDPTQLEALGVVASLPALGASSAPGGPWSAVAQLGYAVDQVERYCYSFRRTIAALTRDAQELRETIYEELNNHLGDSRRHYQTALWVTVPACVVGLLLTIGLMRSFYSWLLNPISDLEAGVRRVAAGDFSQRIEVYSGDEMEELGAAFNDMMQRLQDLYTDLARQVNERSRELVRSERLASVGFLAAGVAHEINNPLASIAFCSEALEARLAELLRGGRRTDDYEVFAKYLKMIQEEAFRCKNITERLLAFSRSGERRREMVDLGQLVQAALDVTQHLQNARGKRIDFAVAADRSGVPRVTAPVNAEEIKQVLLNLIVNALDSMDEGGVLTLRLAQRNGMAELTVRDTGCGMTQEVLENIFEPFFTRSRTGKGTGLGLTISHRIISQHGGDLEAASDGPDRGSTFTVRLPLQIAEPPAQPAAPEVRKPRGLAA
jgi:signal transduction histidine kinase